MAKYKSRSARAGECAQAWRDIAERLRDSVDKDEANGVLSGFDGSELESLLEEMESWRDNTEEKFGQTDKWSQVSEACDALGSVDVSDFDGKEYEDIEDFKGSHETDADQIEQAADELEAVEFPGMY